MEQPERLLRHLVAAGEAPVSGEALGQALGLSRMGVSKAVERLRRQGYVIESSPRVGHRLISMPDLLTPEAIRVFLPEGDGRTIRYLESTGSTNNDARELAESGAPQGSFVVADTQQSGRGRMGRSFFTKPGAGLYLSMVLRPELSAERLSVLTAFVAVAACNAVERCCGLRPSVKWCNDLMIGEGKLCGILTEMSLEGESGQVRHAVAGIGFNIWHDREDFPEEIRDRAVSLRMAGAPPKSRAALACALALELDRMMAEGLEKRRAEWLEAYRRDCATVGQRVTVTQGNSRFEGTALAVDDQAALVVRFEDGSTRAVNSGEVTLHG